jgi:hypothetical protein
MSDQVEMKKMLIVAAVLVALSGAHHARAEDARTGKDNLIYSASAIGVYKANCSGEVPAGAWEAANVVVRTYGQQAVVEKMVELTAEAEKVGMDKFCAWVEEKILKRR